MGRCLMRRRIVVAAAVLAIVGMATAAAAQPAEEGTPIRIAVPSQNNVDGELELAVFTRPTSETRWMNRYCFGTGAPYPVYSVVIIDQTTGQHGLVAGVVTRSESEPGTRITELTFAGYCTDYIGNMYNLYDGFAK
jgi:hypothetical protein